MKNEKTPKKPNTSKVKKIDKLPAEPETLNFRRSRKLAGRIILGLVLALLAFFFIKTAIWEHNYYHEKEGLPRAVTNLVETVTQELDETEVTETERAEYTVAPDLPRYLTIEKLGIRNARILQMGINDAGELDTPRNIFDVGWYAQSGKPGSGGVLVIDGHNGGPNVEGVFKHIDQLYTDDEIIVERGDGEKFTYRVVENKEVPIAEADEYMHVAFSSPSPGTEALTLISCIGEWSQSQQTYLSRQFTRAILKK